MEVIREGTKQSVRRRVVELPSTRVPNKICRPLRNTSEQSLQM